MERENQGEEAQYFKLRYTDPRFYRSQLHQVDAPGTATRIWNFGGWSAEDQYGMYVLERSSTTLRPVFLSTSIASPRALVHRLE